MCVQLAVLLLTAGVQAQTRQSGALPADVMPNDNKRTAGELRNGLLRISVEAREVSGSRSPAPVLHCAFTSSGSVEDGLRTRGR